MMVDRVGGVICNQDRSFISCIGYSAESPSGALYIIDLASSEFRKVNLPTADIKTHLWDFADKRVLLVDTEVAAASNAQSTAVTREVICIFATPEQDPKIFSRIIVPEILEKLIGCSAPHLYFTAVSLKL